MHRRINVTLPEETVRLLERVAPRGGRSRMIVEAVNRYVEKAGRASLRRRLREGAVSRAKRDLALAKEWFFIDKEAWLHGKK